MWKKETNGRKIFCKKGSFFVKSKIKNFRKNKLTKSDPIFGNYHN